METAEEYWLKQMQSNLITRLHKGDFKTLSPFKDDRDILRVGGGVDPTLVSYDDKRPALLPHDHHLPTLTPRRKCNVQNRNVKVNDFVIVSDSNTVRGKWSTGNIVEVFQGDDGLVRNVKVKTTAGIYTRPISKICVIYPVEGYEDE